MKVFLSSTFLDLVEEREAVLEALQKKHTSTLAMEYFLASPDTPLETALENLRNSDVMILVIGFKAGTILPDGSGFTYTSAEYDELLLAPAERYEHASLISCFVGCSPAMRLIGAPELPPLFTEPATGSKYAGGNQLRTGIHLCDRHLDDPLDNKRWRVSPWPAYSFGVAQGHRG